jgi:MFS family permease
MEQSLIGESRTTRLGDVNFRLFWLGHGASTTGDAFGFVAMPLLVLQATGSVAQMGLVTALACAGQIVAGVFSGVVVDRVDRRRLMIACDVGRLVMYLLVPAAWWLGHPSVAALYAMSFLAGLLGNLFTVAQLAAIPNLTDTKDVARANARLQATHALTFVLGAMLAGAVAARFGPATALGIDALSFGASALCLVAVRFRQGAAARSAATHGGGALAELMVGVRFLFSNPMLRSLAFFQTLVGCLASVGQSPAVIDLMVFRLRSDLGESSQTVGVALGMASLGALVGALASPRVQSRLGFAACAIGGTGVQAVGLVVAGSSQAIAVVVAGLALWSAGLTTRGVACNSLRQTITPDALLGRVSAAGWTLAYTAGAAGALFVTWVAARAGIAQALIITGSALGLISVAALYSPLNRAVVRPPTAVGAVRS